MEPDTKTTGSRASISNLSLHVFGAVFGLLVGGIFGLWLPWLRGTAFLVWPWGIALAIIVVGLLFPAVLKPLYWTWMKLGDVLNAVMSRVLLGVVFYITILPVGIVLRLLGKDPLKRQQDSALDSYRITSQPRLREGMERPF